MKKSILCVLVIILFTSITLVAQEFNFSGKIIDQKSNNPISGASISILNTSKGTISDSAGLFRIDNIKAGTYSLELSYVGYQTNIISIDINKTKENIILSLSKKNINLQEVEVSRNILHKTERSLKIAAPLKDLPLSTVTVEKELLEQKQITSLNDALQNATGITATMNYGGFQTFSMRGFGSPVIMLDGARDERMNYSSSAPVSSLASVEKVELLKGPASVLYGHSAVGGILNIVQKKASKELKANFSARYGSWDSKNIFLGAGDALTDKLSYRFDIGLSDRKGWRDNGDKTSNAYLAIDYSIDEKNSLDLRFNANNDLYGTEAGLPSLKNDVYSTRGELINKKGDLLTTFDIKQRYNDPQDFLKHKSASSSLKYSHEFNPKSRIDFKTSYNKDIIDYFSTEELTFLTADEPIYDTYYMSSGKKKYISLDSIQRSYPLRFAHYTNTYQHYLDYTNEINIGDMSNKILIGMFSMNIDRTSYKGYNLGTDVRGEALFAKLSVVNPSLNAGNLATSFSAASLFNEWVHGIYFQDLISVLDNLKIMIGARYDYFSMSTRSADVVSARDLTNKSEQKSIVNNSFTYRFGAVYQPTKDISLYASYSTFFKPKRTVYNDKYIYLDNNAKEYSPTDGGEVFKPESGYQMEAGLRYSIHSSLNISASTYYILKDNIVEYLGKSAEDKRVYGQVGLVDSKGLEIDLIWSPIEALKASLGYTYNEAKYKEYVENIYQKSSNVGNLVAKCPKNQFFSWLYYSVQKGALKNLNIGFGTNYRGAIFTDTANSYELAAYFLMDASLGYSYKNMYLKFKLNNIANKIHFTNTVYSNQYIPGYGRNASITIGLNI